MACGRSTCRTTPIQRHGSSDAVQRSGGVRISQGGTVWTQWSTFNAGCTSVDAESLMPVDTIRRRSPAVGIGARADQRPRFGSDPRKTMSNIQLALDLSKWKEDSKVQEIAALKGQIKRCSRVRDRLLPARLGAILEGCVCSWITLATSDGRQNLRSRSRPWVGRRPSRLLLVRDRNVARRFPRKAVGPGVQCRMTHGRKASAGGFRPCHQSRCSGAWSSWRM